MKFYALSATVNLTNLPDMTSLAASGRLQNAIKYCTKVPYTGATGKESNYLANVRPKVIKWYVDICADLVYGHT